MNQKQKQLTLTLPISAMEVVLNAVAELPFRIAQPLMQTAEEQFKQQQTADAAPATEQPAA